MNDYLSGLLDARRHSPRDDLLTRLLNAELEGERLSQSEILGFFQLLLLAGSETTSNLLSNAIISLCENAGAFARLRQSPQTLIPSTIEEVLRYRSPVQWMFRLTREAVDLSGQTIPAGAVVLAMIGSANRDPRQFANPEQFDISRDPNPHIAFGSRRRILLPRLSPRAARRAGRHGGVPSQHGGSGARSELPWTPSRGLHVHGPTSPADPIHAARSDGLSKCSPRSL
jgi:cytochrome P450